MIVYEHGQVRITLNRRWPDPVYSDGDPVEWYEDANPWDAHTVEFGDTLERIDQALELHQESGPWTCSPM